MKYLSIVVPSYNAEKYLNKCVDSLLVGGEDVEIIIVNDGSKDNTLKIAKEYEEKYPTIVKVVDKPNGGHGSGVNAGIDNATGLYFKCVDSDDWVDADAYKMVLDTIKKHYESKESPDLYLTNFVYERLDEGLQRKTDIQKEFPLGRFFTWEDIKNIKQSDFIMMHMLIFRLDILKKSKVRLLEHTFYVDNQFCYVPLYHVTSMFYIDCDFYRYYVGRPNQSVTFANMSKNYQHQLRVMRAMSLEYSLDDLNKLSKAHRNYLIHDLTSKSFLTLFYVTIGNSKTRYKEYKEYFKEFKEKNPKLYHKVRYRTLFIFPFLLIKPLRVLAVKIGYKKMIKKTGWN